MLSLCLEETLHIEDPKNNRIEPTINSTKMEFEFSSYFIWDGFLQTLRKGMNSFVFISSEKLNRRDRQAL